MIYLIPTGSENMKGMDKELFGCIRSPSGGNAWAIKNGYKWAADCGAYTGEFYPEYYFKFLEDMLPWQETCLFAVCPDKWGDCDATLEMYNEYSDYIDDLGYPIAFVAQDGQENKKLPYGMHTLFIGGTDEWRISEGPKRLIMLAHFMEYWVHVGRVNSEKAIKRWMLEGVDSVDGTTWVYGPKIYRRKLNRWLRNIPLFPKK